MFDGLKVHPTGNVFATGPGGVLVIKENGDHIGTIRTEVRTANCAFDENFQYLYMTSDMFLTGLNSFNYLNKFSKNNYFLKENNNKVKKE